MLSRLTPGENQKDKVKQARLLIAEVKKTKVKIKYGPLGSLNSLFLEVHTDASFGNVDEKTKSTEGAVVILRGSKGTGLPIYWRSKVIARVCKSAKSAETCALEDAIDSAINIGRQVHQIRTGKIEDKSCKIIAMTDSKGLVDSLSSTKQVSEGRMRLNVARIKEYLRLKEIAMVKWVPTTHMLADSLTKSRADPSRFVQSAGDWKDGVGGSPHLKSFCQVISPSIGRRGFARLFRPVLGEEVSPGGLSQTFITRVTGYFIYFMHFIFLYILSRCISHYVFYDLFI